MNFVPRIMVLSIKAAQRFESILDTSCNIRYYSVISQYQLQHEVTRQNRAYLEGTAH